MNLSQIQDLGIYSVYPQGPILNNTTIKHQLLMHKEFKSACLQVVKCKFPADFHEAQVALCSRNENQPNCRRISAITAMKRVTPSSHPITVHK